VITPQLSGIDDYKHLSYASSLCGNCTEVCPVRINLHELLLENRSEAVQKGYVSFAERMAWKVWRQVSMNRSFMNMGSGKMKNWLVNSFVKGWKEHRGPIQFPEKNFNQLWRERKAR
jgi:L-lactate dehydrogenase complex protein LldF